MGKKSRRVRTKPGPARSNAQSEEPPALMTICIQIDKLCQKEKWEEILDLESEFILEAEELDKHRNSNNLDLCAVAVVAACGSLGLATELSLGHTNRAMEHYRMGWSLADSYFAESSLADSKKSAFHISVGQGLMLSLRELARPDWLGQSINILKRMIEKSLQEEISPYIVLVTALSLVEEGRYNDVYDILTAMLDTIDNTWEDKYKSGAYAALCSQCCVF